MDAMAVEFPDFDDGDTWHSELLCCQNPTVTDDYMTAVIGHNGHHEAKLSDAICELVNLTLGMLTRVAGIQKEVWNRPILNLDFDQPSVGRRVGCVSHTLLPVLELRVSASRAGSTS